MLAYFVLLLFLWTPEEYRALKNSMCFSTERKRTTNMFKLAKVISVLALGLMLSLALCTSGAFAQRVDTTPTDRGPIGTNWQGNPGYPGYYWNRGGDRDPGYYWNRGGDRDPGYYWNRHSRCAYIPRIVRTFHGLRRVWIRECNRYRY